jgi:hypothetical protein
MGFSSLSFYSGCFLSSLYISGFGGSGCWNWKGRVMVLVICTVICTRLLLYL